MGRLNDLLRALRDKGNTVLVVEHDPDVIETPTMSSMSVREQVFIVHRSSSKGR